MDIKDYQKEKAEKVVTVRLTKRQFDFLKRNKLNLSKVAREILNKLMEGR